MAIKVKTTIASSSALDEEEKIEVCDGTATNRTSSRKVMTGHMQDVLVSSTREETERSHAVADIPVHGDDHSDFRRWTYKSRQLVRGLRIKMQKPRQSWMSKYLACDKVTGFVTILYLVSKIF